ncbi:MULTISPECIES: hypothetical protein [Kitasatospora]|uniref:hypothetical protein n=1 Tax=Kitasatospora TaxID=2063 RepID=UPI0004BF2C2D|nr:MULTISPECIES: hypothetical protein [Kitasatospora]
MIEPTDPYLAAVRAGEPLHGGLLVHRWPELDVKVVNNTGETVLLHEALLDVTSSEPDLRALPFLTCDETDIVLFNGGWGPLTEATVTYSLFDTPDAPDPLAGPYVLRTPEVRSRERHSWSVEDKLSPFAFHGAGRLLPRHEVAVRGVLAFTHTGADGAVVHSSNPFTGWLVPRRSTSTIPRIGSYLGPGQKYSTALASVGTGYRVSVPLSQVVQAGEADRFSVTIASDRSAFHSFSLVLRYNDGQELVVADRIHLALFLSVTQERHAPLLVRPGLAVRPQSRTQPQPRRRWWQRFRRP